MQEPALSIGSLSSFSAIKVLRPPKLCILFMLMFEKFGKSSPGAELLHIPFPSLNLGLCSTACCCELYNPCFWPLPIQQQLGFHPVSAVFGPFLALDAVGLQQVLLRFISFWNLLLSFLLSTLFVVI